MISSLFITTTAGEVIIEKQFREKIPRTSLEDFWNSYVTPLRSIEEAPNVIQYSRFAFIHILRGSVVFLGITTNEVPPMLVIEILSMIAETLTVYLKELSEDTLRENFSITYQLLEELIDNGYPLTTELHMLEELVPPPTLENKVRSIFSVKKAKQGDFNSVPWRNPGIKYTSNEIFFDIVESMDVIMDAEGGLVKAGIRGAIEVNCRLSGMPDVLLTLLGSEIMDDVCYHRCVRHARYETDRAISFVPPDGKFVLFEYRCKPFHSIQPPFYVTPQITIGKNGGRVNCMVGLRHGGLSMSEREREVHKLTISIPLPPQSASVKINTCSQGTFHFNNQTKVLTWRIGSLTAATPSLSGEVTMTSGSGVVDCTGESVLVEFQMPNIAISGIRVDAVNVVNESYKPYKGVKYITKAGRFNIRTV
jgi:AP-3 complex subunit mu